eukprot:CAMPEP_0194240918 /NCGR_PEP_ID=MMETSP0158-20130606/6956_1 /TAXON_ID=33649 /ORGANISM="Thalassionema nitzschioides, Strain L26-B" /LENGTH=458 /DNA_ID=CAMNT_0038975723 /DNA_START=15 /DNA_END=1390 /DNA_ORIENTATION=-
MSLKKNRHLATANRSLIDDDNKSPKPRLSELEILQEKYQRTRDILDQLAEGVRIVTRQMMRQLHEDDDTTVDGENSTTDDGQTHLNALTHALDGTGFGADLVGLSLAAQTLGGCAQLAGQEAAVATEDYQEARETAERCKKQTRQACLMARKLHEENCALTLKVKRTQKEKKVLVEKVKALIETNKSLKERQSTRVALEQYVCDALEVHESQLLLPRRRRNTSEDMIILEESSVVWEEAEEDSCSTQSNDASTKQIDTELNRTTIEEIEEEEQSPPPPPPPKSNIFREIFSASATTMITNPSRSPPMRNHNARVQAIKPSLSSESASSLPRKNIKKLEPKLSLTSDATTVTTTHTKYSCSFDDKENTEKKKSLASCLPAEPPITTVNSTPLRPAVVPPSVAYSTSSHVILSPLDSTLNSSTMNQLINCDEKVLRSLAMPQDDDDDMIHLVTPERKSIV